MVPLWQSQHIPKHQTRDCPDKGLSSPWNQENKRKKKKSVQEIAGCGTLALSSCQDGAWSNAGLDDPRGLFQPNWSVCGMMTEAL